MGAMMLTHVYDFGSSLDGSEGSLADSFWRTHKGHNGTIGCLARIHIEQQNALNTLHGIGYLLDNVQVTTFTEIRYTLYELF